MPPKNRKTRIKKILIIDEFQYLARNNSAFPSVFQKIWDDLFADANVMVILCGSLVSMMVDQTLSYSSPLYGRRTGQIRLKQIAFRDYGSFYGTAPADVNLIEYYSVTGGVPKYIELFEPASDIYEPIEANVLSRQSFLYEEPVFLLEKETGSIGTYFSIIKSIAAGNHKIGHIAADLGIKQSGATKYLQTLIELDIIERIVPITETNPKKSKKGLYVIKDNFIRFWFKFVWPFRNYLEIDNTGFVLKRLKQNFIDSHVSFIYKDICREKVIDLAANDFFEFEISRVGKWWDKQTKIDLVGMPDQSGQILFGECKYTGSPVDADIFFRLREKSMEMTCPPDTERHYVVFSKSGFSQELERMAKKNPYLNLIQL